MVGDAADATLTHLTVSSVNITASVEGDQQQLLVHTITSLVLKRR